jgi:hypothetical protein
METTCAERTNFPAEVPEMALAHAVSDKTVADRSDLFERRRRLMQPMGDLLQCAKARSAKQHRTVATEGLTSESTRLPAR